MAWKSIVGICKTEEINHNLFVIPVEAPTDTMTEEVATATAITAANEEAIGRGCAEVLLIEYEDDTIAFNELCISEENCFDERTEYEVVGSEEYFEIIKILEGEITIPNSREQRIVDLSQNRDVDSDVIIREIIMRDVHRAWRAYRDGGYQESNKLDYKNIKRIRDYPHTKLHTVMVFYNNENENEDYSYYDFQEELHDLIDWKKVKVDKIKEFLDDVENTDKLKNYKGLNEERTIIDNFQIGKTDRLDNMNSYFGELDSKMTEIKNNNPELKPEDLKKLKLKFIVRDIRKVAKEITEGRMTSLKLEELDWIIQIRKKIHDEKFDLSDQYVFDDL